MFYWPLSCFITKCSHVRSLAKPSLRSPIQTRLPYDRCRHDDDDDEDDVDLGCDDGDDVG